MDEYTEAASTGDRNGDSIEWALTLAFCNRVLRWGMEREAERMMQSMEECRKWRYKVQKRLKREEAYRNG